MEEVGRRVEQQEIAARSDMRYRTVFRTLMGLGQCRHCSPQEPCHAQQRFGLAAQLMVPKQVSTRIVEAAYGSPGAGCLSIEIGALSWAAQFVFLALVGAEMLVEDR